MKQIYLPFLLVVLTVSCLDNVDMPDGILNKKKDPTVETNRVEMVGEKTFRCEGIIEYTGEAEIVGKGFCWSAYNELPTIEDDSTVLSTSATDVFEYTLTNMSGGNVYYIRAFAFNKFGYAYGKVIRLETPDVWEEMAPFPGQIRNYATTFMLEDFFFIACGRRSDNESPLGDTWTYDFSEDRWIAYSDYPGEKRVQAASFVIDNSAYLGMGFSPGAYYNNFYMTEDEQSWESAVVTSPMLAKAECVGFSLDSYGYIVGGRIIAANVYAEVWRYSPTSTPHWRQMNDFPTRIYSGIGFAWEDSAFVGFGIDRDGKTIKNIWKYDQGTDTWELFTTAPDKFGRAFAGSGVIIEDNAYFVDNQNIIWELNLSTREWREKTLLPDTFSKNEIYSQYLFAHGHSLYIGLNNTDLFYEYKPFWD